MGYNPKQNFKKIASTRIITLFELAKRIYHEDSSLSDRYLQIARNISTKYKVRFSKDQKFLFCRKCKSYQHPSTTRYRLSRGKQIITCKCGNVRRIRFN